MSIHTKLVGAFDAIILCLTAAMHLVVVFVLLDPGVAHSAQRQDPQPIAAAISIHQEVRVQ